MGRGLHPFFAGPNADWLALLPFLALAAFLYLTARQTPREAERPQEP